MTMTAPSISTF